MAKGDAGGEGIIEDVKGMVMLGQLGIVFPR